MQTKRRQYCFPDLTCPSSASARNDEDCCPQFQPVRHYPSRDGGNQSGDDATIEMAAAIEEARQNGYLSGLQDGQEEGFKVAHCALSPGLENFSAAYDNVTALIPRMADIVGTQVVQLTYALVERVLGKKIQLTQQDLDHLHTSIVEKILRSHRLIVHIHPEDAHDIKALAKIVNLSCPDSCEVVAFTSDPCQTRGQLSMEMASDVIPGDVNDLAHLLPGFINDLSDQSLDKPA